MARPIIHVLFQAARSCFREQRSCFYSLLCSTLNCPTAVLLHGVNHGNFTTCQGRRHDLCGALPHDFRAEKRTSVSHWTFCNSAAKPEWSSAHPDAVRRRTVGVAIGCLRTGGAADPNRPTTRRESRSLAGGGCQPCRLAHGFALPLSRGFPRCGSFTGGFAHDEPCGFTSGTAVAEPDGLAGRTRSARARGSDDH